MNIIEMSTIQVRILAQDTIPYHVLLRPDRVKLLVDHFKFQNHEIPFPVYEQGAPRVLNLLSGEVKLNDKRNIIIENLFFENRKVQMKVKGSTDDINATFSALFAFFEEILDGFKFDDSKIILQTDQSESIAQLDIEFMSLFSPKFRKFLRMNIPRKMEYKVEIMMPRRLSFELSFEQPIKYRAHNLSLMPKNFTLEPRATTTLEDKMFFTASPCPSDVHIELIKEFEEAFKG